MIVCVYGMGGGEGPKECARPGPASPSCTGGGWAVNTSPYTSLKEPGMGGGLGRQLYKYLTVTATSARANDRRKPHI